MGLNESLAAALATAGVTFMTVIFIGGLFMVAPVLAGIALVIALVVGIFVYALDRLTNKPSE